MRCSALLLLLLGLGCLAEQGSGLRAESAALKRAKKKKKDDQAGQLDPAQQKPGEDYVQKALQGYLSNAELTERLQDFERRCKHIATLSKIGSSVEGRWARRQRWRRVGRRVGQVVGQRLQQQKHWALLLPSSFPCLLGSCW